MWWTIGANLGIQFSPFVRVRRWSSESITRRHIEVDANTPSTLPMTVCVGVEEIVEPCVNNVGAHTIRSKSSVVDLGTVIRSDMRVLNDSDEARTRHPLSGARRSHRRTGRPPSAFGPLLSRSRQH
jgi:hypothetical protein